MLTDFEYVGTVVFEDLLQMSQSMKAELLAFIDEVETLI
jgi:hypothetical protein